MGHQVVFGQNVPAAVLCLRGVLGRVQRQLAFRFLADLLFLLDEVVIEQFENVFVASHLEGRLVLEVEDGDVNAGLGEEDLDCLATVGETGVVQTGVLVDIPEVGRGSGFH